MSDTKRIRTPEEDAAYQEKRAKRKTETALKKAREEIVVPHWPRKASTAERIGNGGNDHGDVPGCDTVWIYLRPRDLDTFGSMRQLSDVGVYVWFSGSRKFQISVKGQNIHSADERELGYILGWVKTLGKKIPDQLRPAKEEDTWEPLHMYLPRLMAAFGITHCVQYTHGGLDLFAPIYLYLEDLNKDIQRRITRMARS